MIKKTVFIFCLISICVGLILIITSPVFATGTDTAGVSKLRNPLGTTSIPSLLGKIIHALLGIVGSVALLMFIYGGFTWLTAAGVSSRIEKGKNIIVWATIGLVFIFVSYIAVDFVINALVGERGEEVGEEEGGEDKTEYCEEHPDEPACIGFGPRESGPEPDVTCFYRDRCICETVPATECLGWVVRSGPCPPAGECAERAGFTERCCCSDGEASGIGSAAACRDEEMVRNALGGLDTCTWMRASACPSR